MADINKRVNINIDSNANQVAQGVDSLSNSLKGVDQAAKGVNTSFKSVDATFEQVYGELQPLTTRLGEAEDRLYELALAGKTTSQEYKELLATVTKYRSTQIATDKVVDAAATKLSAKLGGALQGVASGFSLAQGAQALMGVESEKLQQTLLKVQAAMAVSQGITGLSEAANSFKALGTSAKTALSGIRSGIAATGVGLLVVALGTIVAYWDDIKEAVGGVSSEQKALTDKVNADVTAQQKKLDAISEQENTLRAQGKTEKEILGLKISESELLIKDNESAIKRAEFDKTVQVAAAKRNQEILAGTLKFLSLPLTMILKTVDAVGKALGKDFGLEDKLFKGLSSFVFDPIEVGKEADAAIEAQKKGLTKAINDLDGYKNQVKAINKGESDEKKAKNAEDIKTEQERLDAIKDLEQNNLKEIQDLKTKSEADKVALEKQRALDELNALKGTAEEKAAAKLAIEEKYRILTLEAEEVDRQARAEKEAEQEALRAERRQIQLDKIKEENALLIQAETDLKDAKRNALEEGLNIFLDFAGKNKAIALGILAIQKGLAIADVITNASKSIATQSAATAQANAATNAFYSLAGPVGQVAAAAQIAKNNVLLAKGVATTKIGAATNIAAIVAAGLQGAKSITASGGGASGGGDSAGGGVSASASPSVNFQSSSENQIATSIGNQNRNAAPIKTYVVASEVSTQQSLERNIVERSSL
jgi:hypothetical protein